MKRLEIIHLRSAGEPLETLSRLIADSVAHGDEGEELYLYRRHGLETDLAVHIHHRDGTGGHRPSDLALRVAASLRTYGLVEHTLWEESR